MILSEFAGAAQSLNGSIVVNPWDSQQVADAIHEAVTMEADTRAENNRKLFKVRLLSLSLFGLRLPLRFSSEYTCSPPRTFSLLSSPFRTNTDTPSTLPPTQYVTKYSAAFWGTSFVREMSKIRPEDVDKGGQAELQPAKTAGNQPGPGNGEESESPVGGPDATVITS